MISATRKPGHNFLMKYGYAGPERKIPKAAGLPVWQIRRHSPKVFLTIEA